MISKIGFYTSLVSYLVFWLADVVRPGFVTRYFSVHLFLVPLLLFGIVWTGKLEEARQTQSWFHFIILLIFLSLCAALIYRYV